MVAAILLVVPVNFSATPSAVVPLQPDIGLNGFFSVDKAQRGRIIQAALVMDIPDGYHVNSNRPLGKYAIPTVLKIDAPGGIKVGPVTYPRSTLRNFSFSQERLAVYEGRAVMRFNVIIPANYETGVIELRASLRYQSCSNDVCFKPETSNVTMPIAVVGANESVKRINGQIFGGGRRRK
jgi:DsbC/DsbD-like thiol-disulfide interchange protein